VTRVQILMPIGGLGSRFTDRGYITPKPLIEVDGKPMFMKVLDSFSDFEKPIHTFVVRREHVDKYKIDEKIKDELPEANISILDHNTDGAVETCLIADKYINDDLPIIIADCDVYFESKEYSNKIQDNNIDGLLLTFNSSNPRYSYVELDENSNVTRTAEKIVISNYAILGGYFFKTGRLFKETAKNFVNNPLPDNLSEYFVSHLFNMLIQSGKKVEIAIIDKKDIFGTPEELEEYNKGSVR